MKLNKCLTKEVFNYREGFFDRVSQHCIDEECTGIIFCHVRFKALQSVASSLTCVYMYSETCAKDHTCL